MNEVLDKIIIRVFFILFIALVLYIYKYAHAIFYPTTKRQLFKRLYPSNNTPDTLHLFARILGITYILSGFYFNLSDGVLYAAMTFVIQAVIVLVLYLTSVYIVDNILLYNYEYYDEVVRRKNTAYGLISFAHATGQAHIIKTIVETSQQYLIITLFLWLLAMVLIGFATKSYNYISKLQLNWLMFQKNIALGASYLGFFWGWCLIISSSLEHTLSSEVETYAIQVVVKIILSILILPLIIKALTFIFNIEDELKNQKVKDSNTEVSIGYGVYEGVLYLSSAFITVVITEQINFGTFYPVL